MAQNQRRRPTHSKTAVARQSIRDYFIMAIVTAAIVFAVILFMRMRGRSTGTAAFSSASTFLSGVSVNGVELGGMTYEDGVAAVQQQVQDRLNSPINVTYNDKVFTITPAELDAELTDVDMNLNQAWSYGHFGSAEDIKRQTEEAAKGLSFNGTLKYSEDKLDAFVESVATRVNKNFKNATLDITDQLTIIPHENGLFVEQDVLKNNIVNALEKGSTEVKLVPKVWKPTYTTDDMSACRTKIAECKTNARSENENRNKNIIQALKPFAQMIVEPGQQVSFNQVVGKRTIENNFYTAPEFVDGLLVNGVGGGTCQASSTLYVALVRAGFTINQRTQHSRLVAYCNPSMDATVTDRGKDLVFTNNTKYPMYIFASANYTEAVVKIYGMRPEYKIEFTTAYDQQQIKWKGYTAVKDTKHKHVKEPGGAPVIKKEGQYGCVTRGVVRHYDWETGELLLEETLFRDEYQPVKPEYYVWADD